jgi:cytochrome c oxidase assembly factor CtaG
LAVLAVALASPLELLADSSVTGHMVQHLLITLVAAPLLAWARPLETLKWTLPRRVRKSIGRRHPTVRTARRSATVVLAGAAAYVATMSLWHASSLYELAVVVDVVHATQHLAFLGAGVALWTVIRLQSVAAVEGRAMLTLAVVGLHGVFLSALFVFSDQPFYEAYPEPNAFGVSRIDDQHLAGVTMWFWSSFTIIAAVLAVLRRWLASGDVDPNAKTVVSSSA